VTLSAPAVTGSKTGPGAVVTSDLIRGGTENVRVIGASVMPGMTVGNTHAPP
ncbi:MAG: hypothetical protein GDA39_00755, partial [Hyphomonadaceae bacterium]|nr:hypothetical protein [Hyphomonadaceae bacterium]